MLIIDKSANASPQVIQLRDTLITARQVAEQLQRQANNCTPDELLEVQGITIALNAPYLATLASVLTSLQSDAVELYIGAIA